MPDFAAFGNDLYTGKRSFDFVGTRRRWYAVAAVLVLASVVLLLTRGLNPGIEFRGGSEFRVSGVSTTDGAPGTDAVVSVVPEAEPPRTSSIGDDAVRIQTERLDADETEEVSTALAQAYGVEPSAVTSSFVGPTWGQDVTDKAVRGLVIFLLLAGAVLAVYFRTWKMAVTAMVALVHDVVLTAGVYSLSGFEVTPATVVGFLTILGYSLYDTVVVFDKVRENTQHVLTGTRRTYAEAVNLAVNQTLVRSINTSVVALLPIASILFIGAFVLGAGTLRDIALSLFVGILAGAYSSIFLAPPLFAQLMEREPRIAEHARRVRELRASGGQRRPRAGRQAGAPAGAAASGSTPSRAATAVLERVDGPEDGVEDGVADGVAGGGVDADGAGPVLRRSSGGQRSQPVRRPGGRRR
ncbi:protein translocase subunit SecF [Quadrisphaera sp. DSM 44207]|uniref:protein translocase subunit SecF n=1 Tax=Quadrisphaera sp. DSM 44207 TaxID=1881057 RepID=UPI00088882C5|nr:protein translocase subunit SecF [Quadrisphaera sp. DSM 44207]SDQ47775.1 protein translocase subunit secF [Quadrisphaera sp. DSM 44207]